MISADIINKDDCKKIEKEFNFQQTRYLVHLNSLL